MPIITFTPPLSAIGKPLLEADNKPITLRSACTEALLFLFKDEEHTTGEEKLRRYRLAEKIQTETADLTAEDVTLLKSLIAKLYGPAVVGPAYDLLDPPAKDDKKPA